MEVEGLVAHYLILSTSYSVPTVGPSVLVDYVHRSLS